MPRPLGLRGAILVVLLLAVAGCGEKSEECPSGQVKCGVACLDPATFDTDPVNCGACGAVCGIGTCQGGVCQCEGATFCPGLSPPCRDLQTDPRSCSACDAACPLANEACEAGVCGCPAALPDECPAGAPTRCVNLLTSASDCGTCGRVCPLANDVCVNGTCVCPAGAPLACPAGTPTRCVNPDTDEANCGGCDAPCAVGATCSAGSCACPTGQTVCGTGAAARCTDLQTDEAHCGDCARSCPAGSTCTSGTCTCGPTLPRACGDVCCEGTACCGSAGDSCQTKHFNGVNGNYFDCGPLDQHTLTQARLAAESWSPSGTTWEVGLQCLSCVCRESLTQAAVWCYAGSPYEGFVTVTGTPNCLAASCPVPGSARTAWR